MVRNATYIMDENKIIGFAGCHSVDTILETAVLNFCNSLKGKPVFLCS